MRDMDIFTQLHEAVAAACYQDLDPVGRGMRPGLDDIEICVFPQQWGSTALGYGGIGGAAMTTAYTFVITCGMLSCVYFGCGRLAYKVRYSGKMSNEYAEFVKDIKEHQLSSCYDAKDAYNAEVPE